MTALRPDTARDAYGPLAAVYDLFTAHHRHDVWLARLEALGRRHGLTGRRVLDVGCGTGKSFLPLVRRGYRVTGCDISPEMLAEARRTAPPHVRLVEADMRDLPDLGRFDLVTCLDDAVNYLLGDDDLTRALASMARALAPRGLLVFDTNRSRRTTATTPARRWSRPTTSSCAGAVRVSTKAPEATGAPARRSRSSVAPAMACGTASRASTASATAAGRRSSAPWARPACAASPSSGSGPARCSRTAWTSACTPRRCTSLGRRERDLSFRGSERRCRHDLDAIGSLPRRGAGPVPAPTQAGLRRPPTRG
jgi:ubiquinone/menaquinone biosynthesis C-methylase UbiE